MLADADVIVAVPVSLVRVGGERHRRPLEGEDEQSDRDETSGQGLHGLLGKAYTQCARAEVSGWVY
jgi:hypothetical protein